MPQQYSMEDNPQTNKKQVHYKEPSRDKRSSNGEKKTTRKICTIFSKKKTKSKKLLISKVFVQVVLNCYYTVFCNKLF